MRRFGAVALDVRLRNRQRQIVTTNPVIEFPRLSVLLARGRPEQSKQGVAPHFLENDHARAEPLKRLGEPEEIGEAVAWLCSQRASYVTGLPMPVDGGLIAQ